MNAANGNGALSLSLSLSLVYALFPCNRIASDDNAVAELARSANGNVTIIHFG